MLQKVFISFINSVNRRQEDQRDKANLKIQAFLKILLEIIRITWLNSSDPAANALRKQSL